MISNLEEAFHHEMLKVYEQAKAECKYKASRFLQTVNERGGLNAAKSLLASNHHPEGLTRLWQEGRLDISMEATVLREPWNTLFTDEELNIARKRLTDLGY